MPGQHGTDEEKDMGAHEDKEKEMDKHDKDYLKGKYAMEDIYTSKELAEKRAEEMGLKGSHTHVHIIDEKETVYYMPGASHDEYMKDKEEM